MNFADKKQEKILNRLFPGYVITEEVNPETVSGIIYPEEEVFIEKAVLKRKNDFKSGRFCAKKALAKLGIERFPIKMANDRSPIWPDGIVGSIAHTQGYCGVAVAVKENAKSLGLDMECVDRLKSSCRHLVCTEDEIAAINARPENIQDKLAAFIFSAKECFYKCQFTINRCWAGFHDVKISLDIDINNEGYFEIILLKDIGCYFTKGSSFKGKYIFNQRYVLTGMTIEH